MKYVLSALAVSIALPASADTLGPFTDLLVFGDSLSDGGNVAAVTGGQRPSQPFYPNGQFTNGDTWATLLGSSASVLGGTNFAYGGATAALTVPEDAGDLDIPDFADQRLQYEASGVALGDNPLTAIWLGGNDLRVLLDPDLPPVDPVALIGNTVNEIILGINSLANAQLNDFVVFGLPDLGLIPAVVNDPEASASGSFLTNEFNKALFQTLSAFYDPNPNINVSFFDTQAFIADLLTDAEALGITNVTDACLIGDDEDTPENEFSFCGFTEDPNTYAYFDGLHPTQTIHTALAAGVRDFVTPVPLPGGLSLALGGLVLLGGLGARRKVASA